MIKNIETVSQEILHLVNTKRGPVDVLDVKTKLNYPLDVIRLGLAYLIRKGDICLFGGDEEEYLALLLEEELVCQ